MQLYETVVSNYEGFSNQDKSVAIWTSTSTCTILAGLFIFKAKSNHV